MKQIRTKSLFAVFITFAFSASCSNEFDQRQPAPNSEQINNNEPVNQSEKNTEASEAITMESVTKAKFTDDGFVEETNIVVPTQSDMRVYALIDGILVNDEFVMAGRPAIMAISAKSGSEVVWTNDLEPEKKVVTIVGHASKPGVYGHQISFE